MTVSPIPSLGPTREEIARVIDPRAFMTFRDLCEERGLDADNPPVGVIIMEGIDVPVANRQGDRDKALAKADAVLALFPVEAGDVGWRPIDTAPRDGTPILVARPTVFLVEEGWHVVRWDEHPYCDGNAWVCHDGKQDTPLRGPDPTHWQPLPSPPLAEGEGHE